MNSYLPEDFLACFQALPQNVQEKPRKNYRLRRPNREHPGLRFRRVHADEPIYSIRVGIGWRALGLREGDDIYWFWIGSHADYDNLLAQLCDSASWRSGVRSEALTSGPTV